MNSRIFPKIGFGVRTAALGVRTPVSCSSSFKFWVLDFELHAKISLHSSQDVRTLCLGIKMIFHFFAFFAFNWFVVFGVEIWWCSLDANMCILERDFQRHIIHFILIYEQELAYFPRQGPDNVPHQAMIALQLTSLALKPLLYLQIPTIRSRTRLNTIYDEEIIISPNLRLTNVVLATIDYTYVV